QLARWGSTSKGWNRAGVWVPWYWRALHGRGLRDWPLANVSRQGRLEMRRAFAAVLLAGLSHLPPARGAEDHVWIVGGGPFPDESQAQIEMNVNWVLETLRERLPGARLRVYYTDGEQAGRRSEEHTSEL